MLDGFLARALLAGVGLALFTGPIGCFIVWRRLAYFGETIAHSALLGVALAVVIDTHLALGIFASASIVVLSMWQLERLDTLPTDTLLGLLSHGSLACGLVVLSFFPNMTVDLQALLFGDILAVSRVDLAVIWAGGAVALVVLWWIWHPLLAGVIAGAITIVGVLLIVALLVIPPATVRRFSRSPEEMAFAAALVGVASILGGLLASARLDTPSGPSIVLAAIMIFTVTRLIPARLEA